MTVECFRHSNMPTSCCVVGCTNYSSKHDCISRYVSYHKFPLNNKDLLKAWVMAMRRENFKPTLYTKICSDHFEESCFVYQKWTNRRLLKEGSIPTIFNFMKKSPEHKSVNHTSDSESMPFYCSAYLCPNVSTKAECKAKNITFHSFPLKNELLLSFWLIQIGRKYFKPSVASRLCSEHFDESCFTFNKSTGKRILHDNAVPTKFMFRETYNILDDDSEGESSTSTSPVVMHLRDNKKRKLEDSGSPPEASSSPKSENQDDNIPIENEECSYEIVSTALENSLAPIATTKKDVEVQTKMDGISALLIENTVIQNELAELKARVRKLTFSVELIEEHMLKILTGFSRDLLKAVYNLLQLETQLKVTYQLPPVNQLFLFLIYLRTGVSQIFLSLLFKVSQASVSRICNNISHLIYAKLKSINIWPSRECIKRKTNPVFFRNYPNCRVIIECVEFQIQRPVCQRTQQITFSPRKNTYTVRALIGKSPSGAISYISDVWPGSISDRDLFIKSGILDYLEEGDLVLTDKNFNVREELEEKGLNSANQRFLYDRIPFTAQETIDFPGKSHHRIHYDLAISKINKYKFFETQFTTLTFDIVNEYVYIVSFFANLGNPLINIKQH